MKKTETEDYDVIIISDHVTVHQLIENALTSKYTICMPGTMGFFTALSVVIFILISTDVICLNKDNVYIDSLLYYLPTVSHTLRSLHQDRYNKLTINIKHCIKQHPGLLAQKSPCGHIQYDTEHASNTKTWNITLHGELGLNVTFTRIHLEDSLMECTLEMVSLVRQDGRGIGPYCGNKEPINSIIPEKTVAVKYVKSIRFSRMLIHGFELEYQSHSEIMAYKSTFFFQLNKSRNKSKVLSMIPNTINDVRLLFTVVSDIYTLIQVELNTSCVDTVAVRDGPSSQADQLPLYSINPNQKVSNYSSAFVLLVEARYLMDKCRYKQVYPALYFVTIKNPQFPELIPERKVREVGRIDRLTQSSRRDRKIIIQGMLLTAPLGSHLELSVLGMKADGPVTSDCRYWGVAIFDYVRMSIGYRKGTPLLLADITTPLFRLCKSLLTLESGTRQPVPYRYTSTTNVVAVLWYDFVPVRNNFHVTLLTTLAKCKGLFAYCSHPKYLPNKNIFANPTLYSAGFNMFSSSSVASIDNNVTEELLQLGPGYHIQHALGSLHIRKRRGRVFSFGLPYQDIPCLTMQYIPTYFKRREIATACNVGIVFGRQALKTDVELSSIRAYMCMNVTRIDTGMEYIDLYKIQPSCSGLTFTSSVTEYKPLMSNKDFIRNLGYSHVQTYVDETSVHYLYSLNHKFIFEGNNVIGLVHVQMTAFYKFNPESFRLNHFLLQSDLSKNITKISITMKNCTRICVDILVLYEAPFYYNSVLTSNYFYQSVQLCSQDNATVQMAQYNIFIVRFIQIKQVQGTTSCRLILQINPFIRMQSLLPHIEIEEQHQRKEFKTDSDDNYTMLYVLYERSNRTWWEAQSKCEDRGGNLPSFPTAEEQNIFDHLLLGTQFNVSRNPFVTPARLYPYMGVYIGLNYTTVSRINLIIT